MENRYSVMGTDFSKREKISRKNEKISMSECVSVFFLFSFFFWQEIASLMFLCSDFLIRFTMGMIQSVVKSFGLRDPYKQIRDFFHIYTNSHVQTSREQERREEYVKIMRAINSTIKIWFCYCFLFIAEKRKIVNIKSTWGKGSL